MSSSMMDTKPGGEGDQYEDSIKTVTQPHSKQVGAFGTESAHNGVNEQLSQDNSEKGEQTASNIRYGQKISEEGMGGQTEGLQGGANEDTGFGGVNAQTGDSDAVETRTKQGYGSMPNVGG